MLRAIFRSIAFVWTVIVCLTLIVYLLSIWKIMLAWLVAGALTVLLYNGAKNIIINRHERTRL